MIIESFSHKNGDLLVSEKIKQQIINTLTSTEFKIIEGCADELRKVILSQLKSFGWSDDFRLDAHSQISLTSSIDGHVLCLQTGNMSRFYADLLKLQYVFKNKKVNAAFYIIPSKEAARKMGSNIAHFDRFTCELTMFREIITIPILVIGIN
jgi:hypothetical protein